VTARLDSDAGPVESRGATSPVVTVALWGALLIGFSPVLADLLRVYAEHPWARVSLIFPALAWWASRLESARPEPARWGLFLIVAGIAIELIAVGSSVVRMGRVGLLLGIIGFCVWRGLCSRRTTFLLAWSVPLPATVMNWLSPWPEHVYGALLRGVLGSSASPVQQLGTDLFVAARELALIPADGGLPIVIAVMGFVWFGSIVAQTGTRETVRVALAAGLLGIIAQGVILFAGVLIFREGATAEAVRSGWDLATQVAPVLIGAGWVWFMAQASPRPGQEVAS